MPQAGFEPSIPASKLLQTYEFSSAATGSPPRYCSVVVCLMSVPRPVCRGDSLRNVGVRVCNGQQAGCFVGLQVQQTGNVLYVYGATSCNHCCSGKALSVSYSETLFVALGIRHATRVRHIVRCGLPHSTRFFHIIS